METQNSITIPRIGDTAPDFQAMTTTGPMNVGRDMEEIKRALVALQTADKHKVSIPLK